MIQNIIVSILAIFFVVLAIQYLIKINKAVSYENDKIEFYKWQYDQFIKWKRENEEYVKSKNEYVE